MIALTINVTDLQYRQLVKISNDKHTVAHKLIEELVARALGPSTVLRITPARARINARLADVRRLHAQGLNDQEIARELGESSDSIYTRRTRLGLAANTVGGRPKQRA